MPAGNALNIPYGTQVLVLGLVPEVTVSVDQTPAPVELQMTWNGIPNTVTLSVPASQVVGPAYPPMFYPDQTGVYQMAYPKAAPGDVATYNLWVGDYTYILQHIFGTAVPPTWWETEYGKITGEWFWYKFTPNTGDWIALNSNGQTKFPPTYDITAMFEYGTSQIWFNHVAFDVSLLQLHKDVSYCTRQTINDAVTITNVGIVPATGLDLVQTFPSATKLSIVPDYSTAYAEITAFGGALVVVPAQPLPNYWSLAVVPTGYTFGTPFSTLLPGQTLTITMTLNIYNTGSDWSGTIVFDSMASANQIPAWKDPIGLAALVYPCGATLDGATVPLWSGYVLGPASLWGGADDTWVFACLPTFCVQMPILRNELYHTVPVLTLDPAPVPLIAGENSVTSADVALVRNAVLGLGPYDARMDTNGNGRVDVQDLAAYEAAV